MGWSSLPTPPEMAGLDAETFRKILLLEVSRSFDDKAVGGGMDLFLQHWADDLPSLWGEKPPNGSYARLSKAKRKAWVEGWLAKLNGAAPEPKAPKTSTTPQPPYREADAEPAPLRSDVMGAVGLGLDSPASRLRGVDVKLSAKLKRIGVSTIRDLLFLMPRRHNDFATTAKISELVPGVEQTVIATVWEARETSLGRKLKAAEAVLSDETGNIRAVWFGQPYLIRTLKPNSRIAVSGKVDIFKGQRQFSSPEFEILDRGDVSIHTGRLVPVYPSTEGLTPRRIRTIVWQALEEWSHLLEDPLPEEIRKRLKLQPLHAALRQAHYPPDMAAFESARQRLAFDELFMMQLVLLTRRKSWQEQSDGVSVAPPPGMLDGFFSSLPFPLTAAQERCVAEVLGDMRNPAPPMNRLLQGDVGSGKTVVALAALLAAAASGFQGSIMAPTEVLAEQHFATVTKLLGGLALSEEGDNLIGVELSGFPRPVTVGLMTGSVKASTKRTLRKKAADGSLDILVGTHAIIQQGVDLPKLALAVVDEQHRFGVMQRAALRQKGEISPHLIALSATPIPRTLALTLYGDLDVSTLDQLPPGRQEIMTRRVPEERRDGAYGFVRKEVMNGRQAFVVCPLIEESEAVEARAATAEYERLSTEVFPDLRVDLLHGKMSSRQKEQVMSKFRDGETDILVSTAVVEVGIDVPNATVMLVEAAHRFGVAQLHQFRGRVGRGEHKSYCLLLADVSTADANQRLSAVESIHDGFRLAEVDLEIRGPGDAFGTRQSGLPDLRVARPSDRNLLQSARTEAARLLDEDPDLQAPDHAPLASAAAKFMAAVGTDAS